MRKKGRTEEHENVERWLITYADVITLLLALFIMMYSFSKTDAEKYKEVSRHLKSIFISGSRILEGEGFGGVIDELDALRGELERELEDIKRSQGANQIQILRDERGVVIRILDRAFFDEGRADLKENAKKTIDKIAPVLKRIRNPVMIEGHTDNVPIHNEYFRSNWELSVRRATEVVRYFIEKAKIPPNRLSASGFAEFRPIASNETEEGRALNRRIEIVILKSD
ncbi:MAG: OmpA family protein [Desulfobacterota bacterium]|nr:OmpA family protein [Thermodesulfobacteriota bacterium]MDW8002575.1 OmpA family protein [Deltaproteobacteria bacterium]